MQANLSNGSGKPKVFENVVYAFRGRNIITIDYMVGDKHERFECDVEDYQFLHVHE